MIRIVHTRASGTLLFGAGLDNGPGAVIASVPDRWRFSRSIGEAGAWYLTNSRDHRVRHNVIDRLAAALRAAGYEVEVTITASSNATAAIEADRAVRAAGRAALYTERADAQISSAAVRMAAVDARRAAVPLGQPVINYRYAGFLNRLNRAEAAANAQLATGQHWQRRAEATASTQWYRHQPRTIVRRIERLEANLRRWQRHRDAPGPTGESAGGDSSDLAHTEVQIAELTDQLAYWRAELAALEAAGVFRSWTPADFRPGDETRILDTWYPVVRVNRKTLTVALPARDSHEGRTENAGRRTGTSPYDNVYGRRRDGKELHAPPPAEGTSCTCRVTMPTFNAEFVPERDGGPCTEPATARLTIRHDGTACGCDGRCMLADSEAPDGGSAEPWTEVVLFCPGHAYEHQEDIAAAGTAEAAIFEELS
jgi:hypothetical protein